MQFIDVFQVLTRTISLTSPNWLAMVVVGLWCGHNQSFNWNNDWCDGDLKSGFFTKNSADASERTERDQNIVNQGRFS
jgi:hypothetical protein